MRLYFSALFFTLPILLLAGSLYGQTALLKGWVGNKQGDPLANASVQLPSLQQGTITDSQGNFTLRVPAGDSVSILISYLGFRSSSLRFLLAPDEVKEIKVELQDRTDELKAVEVTSTTNEEDRELPGLTRLEPAELKHMPTAFGDISDVLQTLPGVVSNNELSTSYSVRGGNFDENLVYVNGIPIYRPFLARSGQQEGLSFVNPQMVSSLKFSAGGWQPKWGDKLSSVLEITYKEPDSLTASVTASLLGGAIEAEGSALDSRFKWIASARHKSARYLLGTLDTEGEYLPRFTDVQAFLTYQPAERHTLNLLLSYARNRYEVIPETRETNFGTVQQAFRLTIGFDGQEQLNYDTWQNALKWTANWNSRLQTDWILSWLHTLERENAEVEGAYFLCNVDKDPTSTDFDQCITTLGFGTNYSSIRNQLSAQVYNLLNRSTWLWNKQNRTEWGVQIGLEDMSDRLQEWEFIDSAGFVNIREGSVINDELSLQSHRIEAYAQHSVTWQEARHTLTAGLRSHYWSVNKEWLWSPRMQYAYRPDWLTDVVFTTAIGIYQQPPLYRELRNYLGEQNLNVKAQSSLHLLTGADLNFLMWGRVFNLVGEGYYKKMWNINAYTLENVRIRYFANNESTAWAGGADFRISGEFIPGAESWFSLGVLSTREDIPGDNRGYIRRPTDQRLNVGIFFQDHLPNDPSLRAYLKLLYGSGLPYGVPDRLEYRNLFTAPSYKRVDIGLSKVFVMKKPGSPIRSLWVGLEILNLLANKNVISYSWISDFSGDQYAVPNRLTNRFFNLKVVAQFNKKAAL